MGASALAKGALDRRVIIGTYSRRTCATKDSHMNSTTTNRLADLMADPALCNQVAERLLHAFPELAHTLRLEENYSPTARLSAVAVERLSALARAMLVFELPNLADRELAWASGVLPRNGVTHDHQAAMVRWFFEELRRLDLAPGELAQARDIEGYLLAQVRRLYQGLN
jgi:hypothetical protein